jgi:hypothetical protein
MSNTQQSTFHSGARPADGKISLGSLGAGSHKGDGPRNGSGNTNRNGRATNSIRVPRELAIKPGRSVRPPTYDPNFRVVRKMRFVASSTPSSIVPVTASSLCEAFGGTCVVANAFAVPVFGFIRIKKIEAWGAPAGVSTPSTTSLVWGYQNSIGVPNFGTNKEVSDVSTSSQFPAHIVATPPEGSLAALWQPRCDAAGARRVGAGNVLFSIYSQASAVVDITAELVMYDLGHAQTSTTFIVNAGNAVGAFAYTPFDGIGGYWTPQGVDSFI